MTKLLMAALEAASRLSDQEQDDIAQAVFGLVQLHDTPIPTNPNDIEAIREGLGQIRRGEFASDDEVAAAFARFQH